MGNARRGGSRRISPSCRSCVTRGQLAIPQALADDVAAKLAKFCIQYPPLAGMGAGTIENARIRVRRLSVLRRDYAACADSIPRGIIAGDIRMVSRVALL